MMNYAQTSARTQALFNAVVPARMLLMSNNNCNNYRNNNIVHKSIKYGFYAIHTEFYLHHYDESQLLMLSY